MNHRWMLVLALVASSAPAHAQSASAQAEVLFRQGRDLLVAGKIGEACTAFEASQRLEPAVTTLLNLAGCRERNGQLATALALFSNAEKLARSKDDVQAQQLAQVAATKAAKLAPRLSKLTIDVPAAHRVPGLAVTREAEPIDPATWGIALPIDGGTYKISARAPGREPWTTTVTIKPESDAQAVSVPQLGEPKPAGPEIPPTSPHAPAAPAGAPVSPEPDDEPGRSGHPSRVLPIAVSAGAVALLGGALAFDLSGNSTYDDAKASAVTDYNKSLDLWHSANTKRYVAEGLAVAGLASAGVAVWLFVRGGHSAETGRATAVAPLVTGSSSGIQVLGGF